MNRLKTASQNLAVIAIAIGLGFYLLNLASVALVGRDFIEMTQILYIKLGRDVVNWQGVAIWENDSRYGFKHIPKAIGRHNSDEFNVQYRIDTNGERAIQGSANEFSKSVMFLGDSFTFGHGVEDDQTYSSILANKLWKGVHVRNHGVMAWGLSQALISLQDEAKRDRFPNFVFLGWISLDLGRSHLRRSWLEALAISGRKNAFFELMDGELVLREPAGVSDAINDSDKELEKIEFDKSVEMIKAMYKICVQKRSFLSIIFLPFSGSDNQINNRLMESLKESGIPYVDLRHVKGNYFSKDGHPKPDWHESVANELAIKLNAIVLSENH